MDDKIEALLTTYNDTTSCPSTTGSDHSRRQSFEDIERPIQKKPKWLDFLDLEEHPTTETAELKKEDDVLSSFYNDDILSLSGESEDSFFFNFRNDFPAKNLDTEGQKAVTELTELTEQSE